MTEDAFFRDLTENLKSFSPGDLVAAMELKELIDEGKEHYPEGSRDLFLDLAALFHCYILEGENDELNNQLETLKDKYEALSSSGSKGDKPQEAAQTANSSAESVQIDDRDVLDSFLQESHDHLDTIEDRIITLETNPDADLIDDIFRSMHTIKGVASFIGLNNIKNLSHTLESLLDRLRVHELEVKPDLVNILLSGTDSLANMINHIESEAAGFGESGSFSVTEPSYNFADLLDKISRIDGSAEVEENQAPAQESAPADNFMEDLITDDMIRKFIEESSDLLDSAEHSILELENNADSIELVDHAFRNLHTIKGNSGFFGFGEIENSSMETENLLDKIRKGESQGDHRSVSVILKKMDLIRAQMHKLLDVDKKEKPEEKTEEYKPLGDVLMDLGVSREEIEHAASLQNKKLGEILVEEGVVTPGTLDKALETQNKATAGAPAISMKRKDIRIDMEKLDRLFDMVGELITAEAMVVDSEDLKGLELRDFSKSALHLSKITREIQSITMSMRMIPLEGLFNKMKRLVRDLSRKMDKPVQFLISGADTEMDRNVIEEIADPLVHIIRNAIDHGLEDKAGRKKAGKDPVGIVDLNARYEGNEIWITVRDDGAGLKREKILANAKSKGLVGDDADSMEEGEIWKLIFEPGFSTVDKVSEISGRGVGMDVVKRNIEKLRGRIDINTERDQGTEMILRIPLTLAIIDSISCRVSHMTLAFQSSDVIEFLKLNENMFTYTGKGKAVLNLRSEIIPVIDMNEFYNINNTGSKEDSVIIVITAGGRKAALIVDGIVGSKQIVVKGLPELLDNTRAISGCSVLGNGDVCLIVDAAALIKETLE